MYNHSTNISEKMSLNDQKVPWIPRKMTEGPTRPLVNLGAQKPSKYYKLRNLTLQDCAMNCMFDKVGPQVRQYGEVPPEKSLALQVTISELVTDAHVQIATFISVLSCSVEQQVIYMYFIC